MQAMTLVLLLCLHALAAAPGVVVPQPLPVDRISAYVQAAMAEGRTGADAQPACRELVAPISLCFRVEEAGQLRVVTRGDLQRWGLDLPALERQAAGALTTNPMVRRTIEGGGAYYEIVAPDGREAVILLHPEWLAEAGPDARVALPAVGTVLVWSAGDAEIDQILAVGARKMFEQYEAPLTPLVLRWDGSAYKAWGEAKPKPVGPAP